MKISVDCDITFVRTDIDFLYYLEEVTQFEKHGINIFDMSQRVDYNITKYFPQLKDLGITGFEFWDNPYLYDMLTPIEWSVQTLENLYYQGHDITFVSHVIGDHTASKINFIERFCPFVKDIVINEDKSTVPCDIIIEDRIQNLKGFTNDSVGIILDNKYIQNEKVGCPYSVVKEWEEVEKRVLWLEKNYF